MCSPEYTAWLYLLGYCIKMGIQLNAVERQEVQLQSFVFILVLLAAQSESLHACWLVPWEVMASDGLSANPDWAFILAAQLSQTDSASGHRQ